MPSVLPSQIPSTSPSSVVIEAVVMDDSSKNETSNGASQKQTLFLVLLVKFAVAFFIIISIVVWKFYCREDPKNEHHVEGELSHMGTLSGSTMKVLCQCGTVSSDKVMTCSTCGLPTKFTPTELPTPPVWEQFVASGMSSSLTCWGASFEFKDTNVEIVMESESSAYLEFDDIPME